MLELTFVELALASRAQVPVPFSDDARVVIVCNQLTIMTRDEFWVHVRLIQTSSLHTMYAFVVGLVECEIEL